MAMNSGGYFHGHEAYPAHHCMTVQSAHLTSAVTVCILL